MSPIEPKAEIRNMNKLKRWDRFPHAGVRRDLIRMRKSLPADYPLSFGSSGEGEITIRATERTIYARKYKKKDGWRVVVCRGSQRINEEFPESFEAAQDLVQENLI